MGPTYAFGGPLHGVIDNRWASASGTFAVLLATLGITLLVATRGPSGETPGAIDEDLVFLPGTLAKLGNPDARDTGDGATQSQSPTVAPSIEPPVVEPAVAEPQTPEPHVTTDPTPPTTPRGHAPTHPRSSGGSSFPRPSGGNLPGPPDVRGNPLGEKDGWDDLVRDGDPWATAVMAKLNGMTVRPFGGDPGPGSVRFTITVCKDSEHAEVGRKGGDAAPKTHDAVVVAVQQLELPVIPPKLAATMRERCTKIRYTFEWDSDRVE